MSLVRSGLLPTKDILMRIKKMQRYRHMSNYTFKSLLVILALFSFTQLPALAQSRTFSGASTELNGLVVSEDASVLPKTPSGQPDFTGVWNNSTTTPFERLTTEEQQRGRQAQEKVSRATGGTGAGWLEQRQGDERQSLIVDPPDGRIPITETAIQRLIDREEARSERGEADSWLDRNTWERCITRTLPIAMIPNIYNANYQILQTSTHIAIVMEMIHESRIIPLDERPHSSNQIRQWLGDSRAYWEGDTLVVETLHFNDKLDGGDLQPSHIIQTTHRGSGATLRLVERFEFIDANTIDYRFTVEDPVTYTAPYTVAIPMRRRDTSDPLNHLFEYACHEGNYGMVNLLNGGRADEQGAIDAAALVRQQRVEAGHPGLREPAVPIIPATSRK